jgi:3-oxoacyl-[acyl-carrier-protein] synthase II
MTAPRDIAITGYGVFTAFGFGPDALREGVFAGKPGFSPVTRFDPTPFWAGHAAAYAGVGHEVPGVPVRGDTPPLQRDLLRSCAESAIAMAGLDDLSGAPVILGTNGDHNHDRFYFEATKAGRTPDVPEIADSVPARLPHDLAESLGLGGPRISLVNACIGSTNAIIQGARMIQAGLADTVVCGGAYVVGEDVFSRFDSGKALSRGTQVRPFTKGRSGLLLGDGVAVVVLEAADKAKARGARTIAKVSGWGMASDAYHVIKPHPEGSGLAAAGTSALRKAGLVPEQIGYLNAHGTGTPLNDVAETGAVRKILGAHAERTPVSSTKSMTGHMLEATGAVEVVICLLALEDGVLPPTAGYDEADPACDLDYIPNEPRKTSVEHVLTLNAAFGGVNAALVLSAV